MARATLSTFDKHLRQTISANLKKYMGDMTQAELSEISGIPTSTISGYVAMRSTPTAGNVERLASVLNVKKSDIDPRFNSSILESPNLQFLPIEKHTIPVLGNVHCGTPQYTEQDYLGVVDSNVSADFALIAVGDSMIDAGIYEGDLVFVRRKAVVDNGNLAVVLIGDETAIKKIHKTESTLVLSPANASYEPLVFDKASGEDIKVLGEVVAFTHYLKSYQSEEDRTLAKDNILEV